MKYIIVLILTVSILAFSPNFDKYDGTAVILDLNTSKRTIYDDARADERLSPCSTFKILNSMISLDVGVVKDENETIKWNGTVREYVAHNRDHNMRSAISVSAVWFYQELTRRVGVQKMREGVRSAKYGNMDTSKTPTDFWLGNGSLKISANEQADFLAKLAKNELPFSKRAMAVTKDIITLENQNGTTIMGKTGSCGGIGWFVGIIETNGTTKTFAFNAKNSNGADVKQIALEFLKSH